MKRSTAFFLAALMGLSLLSGCGKPAEEPSFAEEPAPIVGTMEQLRLLLPYGVNQNLVEERGEVFASSLKEALAHEGWAVEQVTVDVAPTETSSGKALDDGTADVVILPASQYFPYEEDVKLLMTATRQAFHIQPKSAVRTLQHL